MYQKNVCARFSVYISIRTHTCAHARTHTHTHEQGLEGGYPSTLHTHTHTRTVCVCMCVCVCVCVYHTYMSSGLEGGYPSTIHAHTRCVYIYIYIYIYMCIYEQWFGGWISKYHTRTRTHTVEYDDGEVIQEDLSKSKVRWPSTDHAAAARGGGGGGVADASGRGGRPIAKCQRTTVDVEEDQVAQLVVWFRSFLLSLPFQVS